MKPEIHDRFYHAFMVEQSILQEAPIEAGLLGELESPDPIVRQRAAEALSRRSAIRENESAVRRLARLSLEDDDSAARAAAVNALLRLEVPVEAIRANALALLSHPSREVRARAGWAMGRFEPDELKPVLPALFDCLATDPDADPKFGALWALARMRSSTPDVIAAIELALDDPNADVRSEAARVLGRLGPGAASSVPALVQRLGDEDPLVRGNAARAIGLVGWAEPSVVAALRALCSDRVGYVREAAAAALVRVGESAGAVTAHDGEDPWLAQAPSVDELLERLSGDDAFRRAEASWLLAKRDACAGRVSDALAVRAVVDPDSDSRWAALYALERIGRPSRDLVETLAGILAGDVDPDVRQGAAAALAAHWPEAPETAFAALADALRDEDPMVRDEAADALATIGPPAASVRPALVSARQDPHAGVRTRAAAALASIDAV